MKKFIIPMATTAMAVGLALAPAVSAIEPGSITSGGASKDNPQNGGMLCEEPVKAGDITTYNCTLQAQQNGSNPQFDIVVTAKEVLNLNLNGQTLTNWDQQGSGDVDSRTVSPIWVQDGGVVNITGEGAIKSGASNMGNAPVINVATGGKMSIQGGALSTGRTGGTAVIYNAGDLTISGTTSIESTGDQDAWDAGAWGITNAAGGNLTISGGAFTQNSVLPLVQNHGNLTISDGAFETTKEGAQSMIYNDDALTISGGDFTTTDLIDNAETATVAINGGHFSDPSVVSGFVAPGFEINADGTVVAKTVAPEEENKNPNTADPIALYATIAAVALLGLGASVLIAKKSNR